MRECARRYILASASPRRAELLRMIIPEYSLRPADISEIAPVGASPEEAAAHIAVKKAMAVFQSLGEGAVVIGADTIVEIEGQVLGKPADQDEAAGMLELLSGRRHCVHTGVGVFAQGLSASFTESTSVWVAPLERREILEYILTGEPFDKAGGYGIQGLFGRYVPRIEGCFFNVCGLPVARLHSKMRELGLL